MNYNIGLATYVVAHSSLWCRKHFLWRLKNIFYVGFRTFIDAGGIVQPSWEVHFFMLDPKELSYKIHIMTIEITPFIENITSITYDILTVIKYVIFYDRCSCRLTLMTSSNSVCIFTNLSYLLLLLNVTPLKQRGPSLLIALRRSSQYSTEFIRF